MSAPGTDVRRRDWLLLAMLIGIWGSAFSLIRVGLTGTAPEVLVMTRLWIGAGLVTGWSVYRGRRLPNPLTADGRGRWVWLGVLGFMGLTLPFSLITLGQVHVSSGVAGILMAIMPLSTVALAHFFVAGERMTRRKLAGFTIGLFGLCILFGPSALGELGGAHILAKVMILAAALSYAVNTIIAKRAPEMPPSVTAAGMLIAAAVLATPPGVLALMQDSTISIPSLAAIAGLGVGATGIASILYMQIIRSAGPSFLALVNYFVPITAAFIGFATGESLGWSAPLALMVILVGVGVIRRGG